MKPERLSRERRKEQTRERLLDAARHMFLKKGLAATSVADIAETAGYTRGAFYSNFQCKRELLIELLRRDDDEARATLQTAMESDGAWQEAKVRAFTSSSRDFLQNEGFPLWVEAGLLACRDDALREHINGLRQHNLEKMVACIRTSMQRDERRLPLQPESLALGLASLFDGLQLRRMTNPDEVNDQVIQATLAGFVSHLLMPWTEQD